MRLADDARARVPFAIVGVVLLLGSATYAATVRQQAPTRPRPDAVAAEEQFDAVLDTAVRRSVASAARNAAGAPVVQPANTSAGRALRGADPFRRYLRLRIYLAVRASLSGHRVRSGGVTAYGSLPPAAEIGLARAIDRVHVRRGEKNGSVHVTVENVTVELRRGGRTVDRYGRTVSRTVATPVLLLHDRVETYQRRLDAPARSGSGLAVRLAARLYPLAWARGYVQYVGGPIENVVANRHVSVLTNHALLDVQRSVFGRSDPAGRRAVREAATTTAATDLLSASGSSAGENLARLVDSRRNAPGTDATLPALGAPRDAVPGPSSGMTVGVNATADRAFVRFVDGDGEGSLSAVVDEVYEAEARLSAASEVVRSEPRPAPDPPGPEWELVDHRLETDTAVSPAPGPEPDLDGDWHRFELYTRRVVVHRTVTRTWRRTGNGTAGERETSAEWTAVFRTGVALDGRHARSGFAPRHPIDPVHESGGPLDGPNLEGVGDAARERLVAGRGGPDELARRAAVGAVDPVPVTVSGRRPPGMEAWLYEDLDGLRRQLRNVSVTVPRGDVGTGEVNPASALVRAIQTRRGRLVDPPATYDGVAGKARTAARAAYVDAVLSRLERRADDVDSRVSATSDVLSDVGVSMTDLSAAMDADPTAVRARRPAAPGGLWGPTNVSVAGSPPYLTLAPVAHPEVRAVPEGETFHPLVARNLNLFTAPYGEVAESVVDRVLGETDRTNLRVAARVLRAAERVPPAEGNATLRRRRGRLRDDVGASVAALGSAFAGTLADHTDLSREARREAVAAGFDRWDTTAGRALAATNGSAATAVAEVAARRAGLSDRERELLSLRLQLRSSSALETASVRTERGAVLEAGNVTRAVAEAAVAEGLNRSFAALRQRYDGRFRQKVPAGLMLTPVPGYWYATANAWVVDVRGTYASFAASARTGRPGGTVTYRRDGDRVTLDVDGDGREELLGRAKRVSFSVVVPVLVVVPTGGAGVGDVDGDMDEQSPGWPRPGTGDASRK